MDSPACRTSSKSGDVLKKPARAQHRPSEALRCAVADRGALQAVGSILIDIIPRQSFRGERNTQADA